MSGVPAIAVDSAPTPRARRHIWGLDNRTLCDLKSCTTSFTPAVGEVVPVCGSCIVAVELFNADGKYLRVMHGEPDQTPLEALEALRGTRWDRGPSIDRHIEDAMAIDAHYPEITEESRNAHRKYHADWIAEEERAAAKGGGAPDARPRADS